jgi:hypothetical protein
MWLGGMVLPALAIVGYLAIEGAIRTMIEGTLIFPALFLEREPVSFAAQITAPVREIWQTYRLVSVPLYLGSVYLLFLAATRLRTNRWTFSAFVDHEHAVVHLSLPFWILLSLYDFQNYPDVYPLLPFGALGFALLFDRATAALATFTAAGHKLREGVFVALVAFLAIGAVIVYRSTANDKLREQRVCAQQLKTSAEGRITAIDGPAFLALLHLRSPTRYVFTSAGLDDWIRSRFGTLNAWYALFLRGDPRVIVSPAPDDAPELPPFLRPDFRLRFAGPWVSWVDRSITSPEASECAISRTRPSSI